MSSLKYFGFLAGLLLITSCEREHLQPDIPGEPEPLVYFIGRIGNDSIRIAGGIGHYVGSTSVTDTLDHRRFNFALKSLLNPSIQSMQISVNNFQDHQGDLQNDLNNSILTGDRHFQDNHNFIPLAATIEWVDAHGIKFTSELTVQSTSFSITEVEDIEHDGQTYKKAIAVFNCNLSDGHGHFLHLINGRASVLYGIY